LTEQHHYDKMKVALLWDYIIIYNTVCI